MGNCFSCFNPSHDTIEDEDSSLLSVDKAKVVEDELLIELRNKQLNAILNSTNDHLIDISTFKSMSNYGSIPQNPDSHYTDGDEINSQIQPDENEIFKVTPIPSSIIKAEMDKQYNDWVAKLGQDTVRKCLQVS